MNDRNGQDAGEVQSEAAIAAGAGESSETSKTVGQQLRAAREARKLSLKDIAEQTKIRPGILTDIETDAHDSLPALTYTIGFIKAYARTVGLDPKVLAARYRDESHKEDPRPTLVDTAPLENERIPSKRLVFLSSLAVVLVLALFWAWGAGWLTRPAKETAAPAPETAESETIVEEAPAEPQVATPDAGSPVTLTAKDEVWLQVKEGNTNLFIGTLKAGETLALPAGHQWTLRTGRAGALEVKVGDKVLPPLGGPVEHVRDRPMTAAALLGIKETTENRPQTPTATDNSTDGAGSGLAETRLVEGANPSVATHRPAGPR